MARPKAQQPSSIEQLLVNKIASIKAQIAALQEELKQAEHIKKDYDVNKVTIESILSLQSAPDVSVPKKSKPPRITIVK